MGTYDIPWSSRLKDFLEDSPVPAYNELAKTVFTPEDWADYDNYSVNYIMEKGKELYYRTSDLKQSPKCYDYFADKLTKLSECVAARQVFSNEHISCLHFFRDIEIMLLQFLYSSLEKGTHAIILSFLTELDLAMGRWWKSLEQVSGYNPYGGALSNKKWILNEVSH